ncbi:MAG TPA: zf-HC2 domain-containing protein [Candidatus Brocadiia bacterium]|nr:zf-HC2 domain-containing protein [Candidatus Brocadiia bacterium]
MRRCESQEQLSAYLDQELEKEERKAVEKHLAGCEACQRELREMKRVSALVSGLPRLAAPTVLSQRVAEAVRQPAPAEERVFWLRRLWPVAAAALIGVVLYVASPEENAPAPAPALSEAPEPAAPPKETWLAAAPEPAPREALAESQLPAPKEEEEEDVAPPPGRARTAAPLAVMAPREVESAKPAAAGGAGGGAAAALTGEAAARPAALTAAPVGLGERKTVTAATGQMTAPVQKWIARRVYRVAVDDMADGRDKMAALIQTWEGVASEVKASGRDTLIVRCAPGQHETLARKLRENGYELAPPALRATGLAGRAATATLSVRRGAAGAAQADAAAKQDTELTRGAERALKSQTQDEAKAASKLANAAAALEAKQRVKAPAAADATGSLDAAQEAVEVVLVLYQREAPAEK